jgi:hypothetical protein
MIGSRLKRLGRALYSLGPSKFCLSNLTGGGAIYPETPVPARYLHLVMSVPFVSTPEWLFH